MKLKLPRVVAISGLLATTVAFLLIGTVSAQALAPTPTGSGGSLSDYLVGVPSSVLGQAETSPLEGAQSASLAPADPVTGDINMEEFEQDFQPPVAAPSAPIGAGGALIVAGAAWSVRGDIADGVLSAYGVDANSAVCAPGNNAGAWEGVVQTVTQQSCSTVGAISTDYDANTGQSSGVEGGITCATSGSGQGCVQLVGSITGQAYCMLATTSADPVTMNGSGIWLQYHVTGGVFGTTWIGTTLSFTGQTGRDGGTNQDQSGCSGPVDHSSYPYEGVNLAAGNAMNTIQMEFGTLDSYCLTNGDYNGSNGDGDPCDQGTPASVGNAVSDPVRSLKCVVVTSTGGVYQASSATFLESDTVLPNIVCPQLPPDSIVSDTKYYETTQGEPDTLLEDLPATTAYGNWAATYPACTSGSCALDVETTSTPRVSCNSDPTATSNGVSCADWFTDPSRSSDFVCTYGGADQDFSECNVLSQFYKPSALSSGQLYADPQTGDAVSGVTSVTPGTLSPGTSVQDPTETRQCFPSGWGALNPVDWVLTPIQCALQWAFVPRESAIEDDADELNDAYEDKAPGEVMAIIANVNFTAPTGCNGIAVPIGWLTGTPGQNMQIMQACPGDVLAPMAGWSRFFGDVVFTVYGLVAVTRHIARIFGFGGIGTAGDSE